MTRELHTDEPRSEKKSKVTLITTTINTNEVVISTERLICPNSTSRCRVVTRSEFSNMTNNTYCKVYEG